MKILIVNTSFSLEGGAEVIAYNTYKLLKDRNYDVYFWGCNKKPYFEEDYAFSKYFTNTYQGFNDYIKNPLKYYYNYEAVRDLHKLIDIIKPDLIHYHNFWMLTSSVFSVGKNIPKFLTIHNASCCPAQTLMFRNKYLCKSQYCKKNNVLPCIINKCVNNNLEASIRRAFSSYIDVKNFKYIDKFITPSNALREITLKAEIGITEDKITTVNNFLPNKELNIIPNFSNNGYFLYIGRLSPEKGIHYLLEAMKDLPRDIPLHIVGKGPDESRLRKYANANNLYNVNFKGFKNRDEINEEYQNCIAVIVPSYWFENFPTINMESFINGKPVIASNIGGIPEQIEHDKNGLLFEPANVTQLKDCILKYWNNPELVVEHGKNAYQKAVTQYSEDRYLKEITKLYKGEINEYK